MASWKTRALKPSSHPKSLKCRVKTLYSGTPARGVYNTTQGSVAKVLPKHPQMTPADPRVAVVAKGSHPQAHRGVPRGSTGRGNEGYLLVLWIKKFSQRGGAQPPIPV